MSKFKFTYSFSDKQKSATVIDSKNAKEAKELLLELVPDIVKILKVEILD